MSETNSQPTPGVALAAPKSKTRTLQSLLDDSREQIKMALPRHLTPERMIRVALTSVQRSVTLQRCTPISIVGAVMEASQLGLEPNGVLGFAYLVPYQNRNNNTYEAQLQIGYRGFIALARRSGEVSDIYSELVFACDKFKVEYGTERQLIHVPNFDEVDRGEYDNNGEFKVGLVGAYAVVRYKDGTSTFEYMSKQQLDRIRRGSKARDNGPWITNPDEMYKKCPIRRLAKRLPLSPEFMHAAVKDEYIDAGVLERVDDNHLLDTQDHDLAAKSTLDDLKARFSPEDEDQSAGVEDAAQVSQDPSGASSQQQPGNDSTPEQEIDPEVQKRRAELKQQEEQVLSRRSGKRGQPAQPLASPAGIFGGREPGDS